MVKTSLLLQLLLVTFCVSLVVVTAMPQQRPARSRDDDDDSDESCEGSHCSSSSKSRESSKKKTNSQADRPRRPSSIDAGPAKHQQTSSTSIKSPGSILDQSDPTLTGAACTTCIGDFDPAGRVGTTGTTTTGQVGADRSGSATTGAVCATCTGAAVPATGTVGTTAGATIQTGGASADPLTGAACTTCTATAAGTAGKTAPIKTPSLTEAGRIRNPAGSAINPSNPSGQACTGTTCTAADPATGTAGTSEAIPPRKPLLGEAGRTRNPGSAIQSDPASTGTPCTTCKTTGTAAGAVGTTSETTINKTGGSSVADPSTGAACTTCNTGTNTTRKPIFGEAGRIRIPGSAIQSDPASTGTACTTCKTTGTAAGAVGTTAGSTINKTGGSSVADPSTGAACTTCNTGTNTTRKPIFGEAGRIRIPGSAIQSDPASTGTACTTCKTTGTATEAVGTTGTTPVKKPSLAETIRIRNSGSVNKTNSSATGAACTTCTAADPATGTASLVLTTAAPVKKTINLIDPARIRKPATPATGSTTCTTCTPGESSLVDQTSAVSDLVKKEADPSLIETAETAEIDPNTGEKMLSRFNTTVVKTVDHIHFNYDDPNKWREHNSLCKGAHQSPINIETRNTIVSPYPDISFFNYDKSYPENLENNGHTGINLFII
uniref:Alpha-carbonic anhydrase domain-containing protein n=1 Tax=Daphnia galeata TaxID=27404 RepID=A0A8J2WGX1_9CRUS|nr:unnamed protein product [Daphnia galeata]